MKKQKTITIEATVIGPVPHQGYGRILWGVRLSAPRLPFYLDSILNFKTIHEAEIEAKKWRGRKIVISITK